MTTIIHIDLDKLDQRLRNGELWTTGWGTPDNPDAPTCLHGAIRYCQPIPGDAQIIQRVAAGYGFGLVDNDYAGSWANIRARVIPDITDEMLAATFGPQWEHVVALCRRVAILTNTEATALDAAWDAAWGAASQAVRVAALDAAWSAAECGARGLSQDASQDASSDAAWSASASWDAFGGAARYAAKDAAEALAVRDLIGQHGFEQEHYDALTAPWAAVIGKAHPCDEVAS